MCLGGGPWLSGCRVYWLTILVILAPITIRILLCRRHHANRVCISGRPRLPVNGPAPRTWLRDIAFGNRGSRWGIRRRHEVLDRSGSTDLPAGVRRTGSHLREERA